EDCVGGRGHPRSRRGCWRRDGRWSRRSAVARTGRSRRGGAQGARRLVRSMKKLKHEAELFKATLLAGVKYAESRKAVEFESTDSASDKALYIYRLLV